MKTYLAVLSLAFATLFLANAHGQVAVAPHADQEQMLASPDPRLAVNKRLVYNFWREVFEAGHMDLADKYMAEGYIQHNPNVPTGSAAFVDFFSRNVAVQPIEARIKAPLVAILADDDLVVLAFVREGTDPKEPAKKYTTTWFDMFRIENGQIAEHWDPATKR